MGIEDREGAETRPPLILEPIHKDPQTIDEITQNEIVTIHNEREAGLITALEAKERMDAIEQVRIGVGEGWFDIYGPPSPELDHLFEEEDRYWERDRGGSSSSGSGQGE